MLKLLTMNLFDKYGMERTPSSDNVSNYHGLGN